MPKKTGVQKARADETRAALIKAARGLFAEKGFFATGTQEIVGLAGVSRGALQHHFPLKENLFRAVFHDVQQDMQGKAEMPDQPESGALWHAFRDNITHFLDIVTTSEVQQILLIDGPAVLGWTEWRRLEAHYGLGMIERAISDGMNAGLIRPQPSRSLAHLLLSMIDEAALLIANAPDNEAARDEVQQALATLLSSLK